MRRWIVLAACVQLLVACPARRPAVAHRRPAPRLTIDLPPALEAQRPRLRQQIRDGIEIVTHWFGRYGFDVKRPLLIERAIVFSSPDAARTHVAARFHIPADKVPATFSGTIDGKTLLLVAPDVFEPIFTKLYPAHRYSPRAYTQLIAHELAHRAHALLATQHLGSEEGMGPRWFFEGVALVCAGQFADAQPPLEWRAVEATIREDQASKKGLSYPRYARVMASLLARFPFRTLFTHARDKDFVTRLARGYRPRERGASPPRTAP